MVFLKDEGFTINIKEHKTLENNYTEINIYKGDSKQDWRDSYHSEMLPIDIEDVKSDLIPFLLKNEEYFIQLKVTYNEAGNIGYIYQEFTINEFDDFETEREVLKVSVYLKKKKN